MSPEEQRRILEGLLLASAEPVTARRLSSIVPESNTGEVRERITELNQSYKADDRGFRIEEVGGGYQLRTLPDLAPYLQALRPSPPLRMSRASLETLAIVAYQQPLTRGEIEQVRSVDVGAVLRSLLERRLVRVAGHREVPGRPMLYATTPRFLEVFGLDSLSELPTLRDVEEILHEYAAGSTEEGAEAPDPAMLAAAFAQADAEPPPGSKPH